LRGNAYALPIKSGNRISELIPLKKGSVRTEQTDDLSVVHIAKTKNGEARYKANELVHIMGPSEDGITGMSMLDAATDTLALWRESTKAMRAVNTQGVNPGGALEMPAGKTLSREAHERLKADLNDDYAGADNAGKWMVLEDGLAAKPFQQNMRDAQAVESRNQQVEDIARIYGVPRPFLMLDDTSWGSGIEQLAIFFVQYALAPWMVAWEQAIMLTLLPEADFERYQAKYNERALLRGSMKDQAEFLSKLLGGTQNPGLIDQNEGRGWLDLPPKPSGDQLFQPATI
jgi:HK97 family phage portal protein